LRVPVSRGGIAGAACGGSKAVARYDMGPVLSETTLICAGWWARRFFAVHTLIPKGMNSDNEENNFAYLVGSISDIYRPGISGVCVEHAVRRAAGHI